jgi:hypothetical protein
VTDETGECEYCGFQNAPDAPYCRDCGRSLWKGLHGRGSMRGRSSTQFSQMVGSFKPPRAASGVTGWKLVVGAVVIVAIMAIAIIGLRSQGVLGHGSGSSSGARTDLCQSTPGPNCRGYQISLPYLEEGRELNVSGCDSVVPSGSGQQFEVSFTTNDAMYAALVPSVLYWGTNVSYSQNPFGFYDDSSAVAQTAWNSGPVPVSGNHSLDATVPTTYSQWCLSWWDPGSPGTVTFTTDAYLTPASSGNLLSVGGPVVSGVD